MAHRHISTVVRRWFLLLQLIWISSGALGTAPISTECPDTFTNGEINTIRCYIDPVAISSSGCLTTPTDVSLTFLKTESRPTVLCSTSYATCTNSTDCGCLSNSGSIQAYWFSFAADEDRYSGGNLTCTVNCGYSPEANNTKGCQLVIFSANTKVVFDCSSTCVGLAVGISCGFTLCTIITVGVLVLMKKIRCPRRPKKTSNHTPNTSAPSQGTKTETKSESTNMGRKSKNQSAAS